MHLAGEQLVDRFFVAEPGPNGACQSLEKRPLAKQAMSICPTYSFPSSGGPQSLLTTGDVVSNDVVSALTTCLRARNRC